VAPSQVHSFKHVHSPMGGGVVGAGDGGAGVGGAGVGEAGVGEAGVGGAVGPLRLPVMPVIHLL
jgi:hypothetical protein